jgi:hypothetical protein
MIDIAERIRHAATDPELRAAASAIWRESSGGLFEPHDARDGIRASDAGRCRRELWYEIHEGKTPFTADVQLFNLDEGTLTGSWFACLLAASLEGDGYGVAIEDVVAHDDVPGHTDLVYSGMERGVVEFKKTNYGRALGDPADFKRYQIYQAVKYALGWGVEDAAVVSIGPAVTSRSKPPDKIRVDWYKASEWEAEVRLEYDRLKAALGDEEPTGDATAKFRCTGCPVAWRCEQSLL